MNIRELTKEELYRYFVEERHTRKQTAEYFGVKEYVIGNKMVEFGLTKPKRRDILANLPVQEILEFYINHSYCETCQKFNIQKHHLDAFLAKHGAGKRKKVQRALQSIPRETLEQYYIVENHSQVETLEHFSISIATLTRLISKYDLHKPSDLMHEVQVNTNLKKYGVASYRSTGECKEKLREIWIQKYGVEHPFKLREIQQKQQDSLQERYGVRHALQSSQFQEKAKQTCLERYGIEYYINLTPKTESEPERRVRRLLGGTKEKVGGREFDIRIGDTLVEVDGDFWHPVVISNLRAVHVRNLVNDYSKEQIAREKGLELIRVRVSDLAGLRDEEVTLENLRKLNYRPKYVLDPNQDIVSAEECRRCVEIYGKAEFERAILNDMVRLVQICQPEFPEIPKTEDLQQVIQKLRTTDVDRYYRQTGTFTFNCGSIGSNVIKSRFRSFWQASNRGSKSPVEAWQDQNIMRDIIKYRVGLGSKEEFHGLGIKQIIQGMNVNRYLVSFFRPELAAAIYKHYLGDIKDPVVFDPSMGFGARLLAFKSLYPDGTYIGCEPNPATFKELQALVEEARFTKVILHNCKLEDLDQVPEYELGFTSPPYFNLEDYRNGVEYGGFEDWRARFWDKLISLPKMYININEQLLEQLNDSSLKVVDSIVKGKNPLTPSGKSREVIIIKDPA